MSAAPIPPFTDSEWRCLWQCAMTTTMMCEQSTDPVIHYSGVGAAALAAIDRVLGSARSAVLSPPAQDPS